MAGPIKKNVVFLKEELNLSFPPHQNHPLVHRVCVGPPGTNVRSHLDFRNFSTISGPLEDHGAAYADRPPPSRGTVALLHPSGTSTCGTEPGSPQKRQICRV